MSEKKGLATDIEKFDKVEVLEEEYIVEKILDKKKVGPVWKYKVKWEGYPEEDCTWEPKENLRNVKYLIEEFESKLLRGQEKNTTEKYNLLKNKVKRNNSSNKENNIRDDEKSVSVKSGENKVNIYSGNNSQKNTIGIVLKIFLI
jgi:hypothetical protein